VNAEGAEAAGRIEPQWNEQPRFRIGERKVGWHHADNLHGPAVDLRLPADDGRVGAKARLPQRVGQNSDGR
jgi:hypothetical protein